MINEPLIQLKDVDLVYDTTKKTVFQHLNLTILPGEFVCVLGPSGCGKSTLLNIMAGYQRVTSGNVLFKGEAIDKPSWHRGVVFQNQALFPWLTVWENIAFGLRARGVLAEQIEQQVAGMLESIGLYHTKDQFIFELSGGMQQRVQLARVLVNQPELVLLDEPLGALDTISRRKMQDFLRIMWAQSQSSFFMITHDIDEALLLGTRILLLNDQQEPIRELTVEATRKILAGKTPEQAMDTAYLNLRQELYQSFEESM